MSDSNLVTRYAGKANGVYREILDKTKQASVNTGINVLVVLQSTSGQIMRPIYVETPDDLHTLVGKRNHKLESKGSYGILLAEQLLEQGPIWVMNIKNINPTSETLQVKSLALCNAETESLADTVISEVYDVTKFWKVNSGFGKFGDGNILSIASVLNNPVTVLITKTSTADYNYTLADAAANYENYNTDGYDTSLLVSDYLYDFHIFKSDLKTANLSVQNAFLGDGINLSVIDAIKADANAKFYATYSGSIGNVIDINGNNLSIINKINADTMSSGVYVGLNYDALQNETMDLLGQEAFEFTEGDAPTVKPITRLGYSVLPVITPVAAMLDKANDKSMYIYDNVNNIRKGSLLTTDRMTLLVSSIDYVGTAYVLDHALFGTASAPVMLNGEPFPKNANGIAVYPSTSPKAGQPLEYDNAGRVLNFTNDRLQVQGSWSTNAVNLSAGGSMTILVHYTLNGNSQSYELTYSGPTYTAKAISAYLTTELSNVLAVGLTFDSAIVSAMTDTDESILLATANLPTSLYNLVINDIQINTIQYSCSGTNASYLATLVQAPIVIANVTVNVTAVTEMYGTSKGVYKIVTQETISGDAVTDVTLSYGSTSIACKELPIYYVTPWHSQITAATPNVMYGIVDNESHYVNGTAYRQNLILDKLNSPGIANSLSDPTIFKCRYMIDTFKTYIEPNAKHQYATLAANASRFLVLTSWPFYHELLNCKNPNFKTEAGAFSMQYVAAGKNPYSASTNSFNLPNSENGCWLVPCNNVIYDDGFGERVVPGAGIVGKSYYAKHFGSKRVYDIVAGEDWPLSASYITGSEHEFDATERAFLEKMGVNVIAKVNSILQVRSSLTAYQSIKSALNHPETIEKVLFLDDYVEPVIASKMFKYNDVDSRAAVLKQANKGCEILLSDGVIADYTNTCDLSNNTTEVRAEGIIVLDTVLYNEFGIRIAVHRNTLKLPTA